MPKTRRAWAAMWPGAGAACISAIAACGAASDTRSPESLSPSNFPTESSSDIYPSQEGQASPPELHRDTALGATWLELGVPGASNRPDLASTPGGWLALSRRAVGDERAPSAWESYLYRSSDGVRWRSVSISADNHDLWLRGAAYGGGHYVLAGQRMGAGGGVILHSLDGERWEEISVSAGNPGGLTDVVFAGSQFFAFSTNRTLLHSFNGTAWAAIELATTVAPGDVTFGGGQYLLVGSGDLQRSLDGSSWQATRLSCELPGACISNPDGEVAQGRHSRALFVAGTYFIDQASSVDGVSWQPLPGLHPGAGIGGYVVGSSAGSGLALWEPGQSPQPLDSVRYVDTLSDPERATRMRWNGAVEPREVTSESFPNGAPLPEQLEFPTRHKADCTSARCVIVHDRLYLVSSAL